MKIEMPKEERGCLNLAAANPGEVWLGMNANFSGFDFDFVIFNYLLLI